MHPSNRWFNSIFNPQGNNYVGKDGSKPWNLLVSYIQLVYRGFKKEEGF